MQENHRRHSERRTDQRRQSERRAGDRCVVHYILGHSQLDRRLAERRVAQRRASLEATAPDLPLIYDHLCHELEGCGLTLHDFWEYAAQRPNSDYFNR